MAEPTTREPLNIEEFRAMAFVRSSLPAMSTRKACRQGAITSRPAVDAVGGIAVV
jgi:hypothetical protein